MRLDLPLGLGNEAKARGIAAQARQGADCGRTCEPERVEQAAPAAELADSLVAPGQVVDFLVRGLLH